MSDKNSINIAIITERLTNFEDNMNFKLDDILQNVRKTNGRVSSLELEGAENRGKAKIAGVLWGGVTSVIISICAFFINKQIQRATKMGMVLEKSNTTGRSLL